MKSQVLPLKTTVKTNLLPVPPNLSPDAEHYFLGLVQLATDCYPVVPVDGALIESAARHFQLMREAGEMSAEALAARDKPGWSAANQMGLSAGRGLRSSLTALRLSFDERGSKKTKGAQAEHVLKADSEWGDLLS